MSGQRAPSGSPGNSTGATRNDETSSNLNTMINDVNGSVSPTSIDKFQHPPARLQALVANITFGVQKLNGSIKMTWASVPDTIGSLGLDSATATSHLQARWIHLPANCMSWVEDTIANVRSQNCSTSDLEKQSTLRDEVWKFACNGRSSSSIHARFMKSMCARFSGYSGESESDDNTASRSNGTDLALYLPYLQWEEYRSWSNRQELILEMKEIHQGDAGRCCRPSAYASGMCPPEIENVVRDHLCSFSPLHDRRTLDQSYFYNISNLASMGDDQIIKTHTTENPSQLPDMTTKMMMVDQLWLWVLNDNTIVTAFPESENLERPTADVLKSILRAIRPALQDRTIKSVNGLIALIIAKCTGVFHQHDIPADLAFFQFFADAIGAAKNEQFAAFERFRKASADIEADQEDTSQSLDSLFSINEEIRLIAKVKAIINDLHKIDFICSQQEDVLRSLTKCSKVSRSIHDLCETVENRRKAWAGMADTATKTYESLRDLMDLKQRQANVSEARTARAQVEVSARHGRSIMLFTIVTIIFLPMSVLATIFSMNVKQFNTGSSLSLGYISAILFPVSIAIAALALVLAFNESLRELLLHALRETYRLSLRFSGLEGRTISMRRRHRRRRSGQSDSEGGGGGSGGEQMRFMRH